MATPEAEPSLAGAITQKHIEAVAAQRTAERLASVAGDIRIATVAALEAAGWHPEYVMEDVLAVINRGDGEARVRLQKMEEEVIERCVSAKARCFIEEELRQSLKKQTPAL